MKKWVFLLACLLLAGLGAACATASSEIGQWHIAEESDREFTDALQLRVTQIDPDTNRVTYEIENPGKEVYGCGTDADFALEVLHNGVWHKMRHEPGWAVTLELHILNPGETKEFSTGFMGNLPTGTYRFIKEVSLEESSRNNEFICCEFVIE